MVDHPDVDIEHENSSHFSIFSDLIILTKNARLSNEDRLMEILVELQNIS